MKLLNSIVLLMAATTLIGCNKETNTERVIVQERQADEKMSESIRPVRGTNEIEISKDSLGKAFMLVPSLISGGQHPEVQYLKPLIISFERSGAQVALFNLTDEQLYSTIRSSRLLQTFSVASETATVLRLNLKEGFTSLNFSDTTGVVYKEAFAQLVKKIQSGDESGMQIKQSFLRTVSTENNSIYIEQVARVDLTALEDFGSGATKKTQLVKRESTGTLQIEIKPYVQNKNFDPKMYDKEQRIGYFLNFAVKEQKDEPMPQISRWDISIERGPIEVRIHNGAPVAVLKAMEEGILYWNRVFGREVVKIGKSFSSNEKQADRSIHVFWIPWDSAGFARAGIQADPLTGEIFRGQVFMTSSWYKSTEKDFNLLLGSIKKDLPQKFSSCVMDQSRVMDLGAMRMTTRENLEKNVSDTIRMVLAHEMGHVFGLRHNFVGSSTTLTSTDAEIAKSRESYIHGEGPTLAPSTTTVMDYTRGIDTAMNGSFIREGVLPYDQAAIDWGYLNKDVTIPKYQYCSDEHIMLAEANSKKVYGCDRFDQNKNIVLGTLEAFKKSEKLKALLQFQTILTLAATKNTFFSQNYPMTTLLATAKFDTSDLDIKDFIYKGSSGFISVSTAVDNLLASLTGTPGLYDTSIDSKILADSKEVGGFFGIIEYLLKLHTQDGGNSFERQTIELFENLDPANYKDILSPQELLEVKETMLKNAQIADRDYLRRILKAFPLINPNSVASAPAKINSSFYSGDPKSIETLYATAYETSRKQIVKKITVKAMNKEIQFPPPYDGDADIWLSILSPFANGYISRTEAQRTELKNRFKTLAVANTTAILEAMNIAIPDNSDSKALTALLDQVDWSSITGITKFELTYYEIGELQKIEAIK